LVGISRSENPFNVAEYAIDIAKNKILTYFLSVITSKIYHSGSSGIYGVILPSYFNEYKKEAYKMFQVHK
jgi:hypothetical protein